MIHTQPCRILRNRAGDKVAGYTDVARDRLHARVGSACVALVLETYKQVPWLAIIVRKALGHERDGACRVKWRSKVLVLVAATNRCVVGSGRKGAGNELASRGAKKEQMA